MLLFHTACGGVEIDGFAPYQLPDGESLEWRMIPFSASQLAGLDLLMRGGRRTVDLRPGRPLAILPFLPCFGPRIPDAVTLRTAVQILRDPRIQRQAIKHYSPPFALSMDEAASVIAQRLRPRRQGAAQPLARAAVPSSRAAKSHPPAPRTKKS
jgi:hypothetical protein